MRKKELMLWLGGNDQDHGSKHLSKSQKVFVDQLSHNYV
jgi:hypothetical protein